MKFEEPSIPLEEDQEKVKNQLENIDEYEMEKIERTLRDVEELAKLIRNYLEMIRFCDEKGIKIKDRSSMDSLRYPEGPAGPDSDISQLRSMFSNAQLEITKNIDMQDRKEIEDRMERD